MKQPGVLTGEKRSAGARRWTIWLIVLFAAAGIGCTQRAASSTKPQEPPLVLLDTWGEQGDGPGQLDQPVAIATDSRGRVYFADVAKGFVHKFESNGTPLLSFEDPQIRFADGLAVDSGGAIYVLDLRQGEVLIYFPDGTRLRAMRVPAVPRFDQIVGITVNTEGDLYVADPPHSRIQWYDKRGRMVKSWAANGGTASNYPVSIASAPDGALFVSYASGGRIDKYSREGSLIASWEASSALREHESSGRFPNFTGTALAVNSEFVFTRNAEAGEISVWNLAGAHVADFMDSLPRNAGICLATTPNSELLAFDAASARVYRFSIRIGQNSHQIALSGD